jgi:uncharacterized protein (TIGR00369 family)
VPSATPPGQPGVPYFELLQLVEARSGDGRSACSVEIGPWLAGAGELGIQAAATGLADTALSYAATATDPGDLNVTLGLHVDFWRSPPPAGARLTATGEVQARQGPATLVQGRILHGGEVLGTASLRAMAAPVPPGGAHRPPVAEPAGDGPGPPSPEAAVSGAELSLSPTERAFEAASPGAGAATHLLETISTEDQPGDLEEVLALDLATMSGAEVADVADGLVELRVLPPDTFERTAGVVHGGAVAALGQLAAACAQQTALPTGVRSLRLGVEVDFLRPTMVGEPLVIRAAVVHRSRRVVLTDVDVFTVEGRRTARLLERGVIPPA